MRETAYYENVTCSKCGSHIFDKNLVEKESTYLCCSPISEKTPNEYCFQKAYLCKRCNKIYDESKFGLHGDVYECKECGMVCWPLTDSKRALRKAEAEYAKIHNLLKDLL